MPYRLRRAVVVVAVAVSGLATGACKEHDSTGPNQTTGGVANSTRSDADILGLLREANRGEIAAGQLALQRGPSTDVKSFATSMVAEHTSLDARDDSLAARLRITPTVPNDALAKQQNAEIAQVAALSGAAFGYHYMLLQVAAHERTLALVDAFIAKAQQAALRTALETDVRPHIAAHLAAAQQLTARVAGP
jgi:putative membrane protein